MTHPDALAAAVPLAAVPLAAVARVSPRPAARSPRSIRALVTAIGLALLTGSAAAAEDSEANDPDEDVEVFDARSCPEIFGDEDVIAANKKRRTGRFHGVKRGPSDITVTHQVAWWTGPKRLTIPEALVVDVLTDDDIADDDTASETTATDDDGNQSDVVDASAPSEGSDVAPPTTDGAVEPAEAKPSLHEAESKAAKAGAGLVVRHGSISSPLPPPSGKPEPELAVAHVELGDAYKEICAPGIYEVSVDDAIGQDARVFAFLDEGVLIEAGDSLAFLTLDDGPTVPVVRMIWRSAYAIAFDDAAAKSTVKKKSKKKAKKKSRKRRTSRRRKK